MKLEDLVVTDPRRGSVPVVGIVAAVLAAAGIVALVLVLKPPPPSESLHLVSSDQCLECHPDVAREWQDSHHAFAYRNPEVRKLSNDFAKQECIACHAPEPVLSRAAGERVMARQSNRATGVDCLSCHAHPEGGVATGNPDARSDAPCRPRLHPRMRSVEHCAACHNQHGTVDQWRAAPPELKGEDCLHCHMPRTPRKGGRPGYGHAFRASHDLEALQSAVTLEGGWNEEGPWTALTNDGAAHNFPTDERSRAADLQARWQAQDGSWGAWERLYRFRDPYRDETDLTNTQLPSGETWRRSLEPPPGTAAGEVRLMYRTNPFMPDAEARELYRVELRP